MLIMMYVTLENAEKMSNEIMENAFDNFKMKYENDLYFKTRMKRPLIKPSVIWKKKGYGIAGSANSKYNIIEMNINYLSSIDALKFIHNTMLHELAHILNGVYGGRNHDKQWKYIAQLLGDDGNRCHDYATPENKPQKEYKQLKCTGCGKVHTVTTYRYNRYYNYICRTCKSKLIQL
jgi:predicted SprT family Zn-dependent metalloprotease